MPITINGTGSITGISAGGLPDACITTDELASTVNVAKAWVNFNGTGTVAIRANYNVSSITDNGTGNYTVNFTTAMVDASYSSVGTACPPSTTEGTIGRILSKTAGAIRILTMDLAGNNADFAECNLAIFR